jgi:hypothetical protein
MTCLLYRDRLAEDGETEIAKDIWDEDFYEYRSQIPPGSTVISRYATWPYYDELEDELALSGSSLIHSQTEHKRIADMVWYDFIENTPETWFDRGWKNVPDTEHGWVVKGRTNSRKWQWDSMMFAETREELKHALSDLRKDSHINQQGLVIREYVPLEEVEEGINGIPFANEWRCFFIGTDLLISGFYWATAECASEMGPTPEAALETAQEAAEEFSHGNEFFVVDVAKTEEGDWTVIELNDGQMSGLSMIDPEEFYTRLRETVQ